MLFNQKPQPKSDAEKDPSTIKAKYIRYDFPDNTKLVHKITNQVIMQDSKVVVGPGQLAIFALNGELAAEPFYPNAEGNNINSGNLPRTIKDYRATYDGAETGVPVDVYFINTLNSAVMRWGTPNPIQLDTPDLTLDVTANGSMRYKITDPSLYIKVNMSADVESLNVACKQKTVAMFSAEIKKHVQKEQLSYFDISSQAYDIGNIIKDKINARLEAEEGFKLVEFVVADFRASAEDLEALKAGKQDVMRAKARRQARDIEGYTIQEERQFDIMQAAASNQGTLGGMMGVGMGAMFGAGLGANMANQFNGAMNNPQNQNNFNQNNANQGKTAEGGTVACANCGTILAQGARFCLNCGTPVAAPAKTFCTNCGTELAPGARFCPNCGNKQ